MGVQDGAIRINDQCKEGEERQKGPDTGVKDVPLFHFVCQRCVDSCKPNGGGQVNVSLDKRNDLGSTLRSGNHQNILCVSQDGVIEQNGKEHQGEWHKLFAFFFGRNDRFDLVEETFLFLRSRSRHICQERTVWLLLVAIVAPPYQLVLLLLPRQPSSETRKLIGGRSQRRRVQRLGLTSRETARNGSQRLLLESDAGCDSETQQNRAAECGNDGSNLV
mmetsp:Transcript_17649/g.44056  ORF Transcript_17649/g.44056 Transcript_17649/m.44056 type:complete len:219 (+) Transcript_17649:1255-1911(+)